MPDPRSPLQAAAAALVQDWKRWVAFAASLALAYIGLRLGESIDGRWYLLTMPLASMAIAEVPGSLRDWRERRTERERVRRIAEQRGRRRHARDDRR